MVKLSRREIEVIEAVSQGLESKEIAALLGIVENTVKVYLQSIYRKLEAKNRANAVYLYYNSDKFTKGAGI